MRHAWIALGFECDTLVVINVALDGAEQRRMRTFATPQQRELEEVWTVIGSLACLAQAHKDSGDERALQKGLRDLQEELAAVAV
jgi:hypothetical protein